LKTASELSGQAAVPAVRILIQRFQIRMTLATALIRFEAAGENGWE
jgi:hypothetical protein